MRRPAADLPAFLVAWLAVGVPYWSLPYFGLDLPNALFHPGLLAVPLAAGWLRGRGVSGVRATLVAGAAIPAAVLARIVVETARDPTSHNLWPFEVVIALLLAWPVAGLGSWLGGRLARRHA